MATDATGTPTSLGIPKFNTAVDSPSGLGGNAQMDAIDALLQARATDAELAAGLATKVDAPASIASGEVPVWDGSGWVRSSATKVGASSLGTGTPSASNFLRGDGSWQAAPLGYVLKKNTTKSVSNSTTTTDLLNGEFTLPANKLGATGLFRLSAWGAYYNNTGGTTNGMRFDFRLGGGLQPLDTGVLASSQASNAQILPWRVEVIISPQNATNSQHMQMFGDWLAVSAASTATLFVNGSGIIRQDASVGGYSFVHAQGYANTSVATTSDQLIELRVTLPTASANWAITLHGALVEVF